MVKNFNFFASIFLLLNSIEFSFSHIFPVKKIIFSNDIYNLDRTFVIQWNFESKGYGIVFNDKLNISLIPYNLFLDIYNYFAADENIVLSIKKHDNGTEEILISAYIEDDKYETTHFILENSGITIPVKYFYLEKDEKHNYGIRFLSKSNQEYIEFGKDLIDAMNIEFKDEKNFVIHNEKFIIKFDEY